MKMKDPFQSDIVLDKVTLDSIEQRYQEDLNQLEVSQLRQETQASESSQVATEAIVEAATPLLLAISEEEHVVKKSTKGCEKTITQLSLKDQMSYSFNILKAKYADINIILFELNGTNAHLKVTPKEIENLAKQLLSNLGEFGDNIKNDFIKDLQSKVHPAHSKDTGNLLPRESVRFLRTVFLRWGFFPDNFEGTQNTDWGALSAYSKRLMQNKFDEYLPKKQ